MKRQRLIYFSAFGMLLLAEICIGLFADGFLRIYIGDLLVTVLLCCLCRGIWLKFPPAGPVLAFSWAVEGLQGLNMVEKLGLQDTPLAVILGMTFDWKDLLCYAAGCVLFAVADHLWRKRYGTDA